MFRKNLNQFSRGKAIFRLTASFAVQFLAVGLKRALKT